MNAPAPATQQEKFQAFEWLRNVAVSTDANANYAGTMLDEVARLAPPMLADGEVYAGILLQDGKPAHHLVLLPGDAAPLTWKKAVTWAEKQGGTLPTRKEQALLFANAADAFQREWYWSAEQYAGAEGYAWGQGFGYGGQYYYGIYGKLRARAVRRVTL